MAGVGAAIPHLLSVHLSGNFLDPASQLTLHFLDTIVDPQEARQIYESIWPQIRRRLPGAPDLVIREAIDVAVDWRHVGQGHDRPFGREHPKTNLGEVNRLSRKLFADLVPLVDGKPGLTVYLARSAASAGIRSRLPKPVEHAVFYIDVERGRDGLKRAEKALQAVKKAVVLWTDEDAERVIHRLAQIQKQIMIARLEWPDRLGAACDALARCVNEPGKWAAIALDAGLVPAGASFLEAAIRADEPDIELILKRYLAEPSGRWRAIGSVLAAERASDLADGVIAELKPTDYKAVEWLSLQRKLSLEIQRRLLTLPSPTARGAMALALARPIHDDDDDAWPPQEIQAEWLAAIEILDPVAGQQFDNHELKKLAQFLGSHYPATLYTLISGRLDAALRGPHLGRDDLLSDGMRFLPPAGKTKLLMAYGQTDLRWLLKRCLAGDDIEWLAEVLDANLLAPEEALRARDGFAGPEPSLREMAKLLIPRGVPPEFVADLAQYGTGWGEESDRAAALIEEFAEYANDPDPAIAAMGKEGVTMYTLKRDAALKKERYQRVRGLS